MPFVESSQSVKSRLHLSGVSTPIIVGIVALFIVSCVLVIQNMSYVQGSDGLAITKDDENEVQPSGLDDDGTAEGERSEGENSEAAPSPDAQSGDAEGEAACVTVFVSGCVVRPGVYELPTNARVDDALDAAGGFSDDAATDAVNLARPVVDGEQIDIPSIDEVAAGAADPAQEQSGAAPGMPSTDVSSGLVNINTADSSELQSLPGVGEATAAKIIASREEEGPFASTEDLKRVSGIGDKKYEALADLITVG